MTSSEYIHVTLDERQIALKDMETSHLLNLRRILKEKHKVARDRLADDREFPYDADVPWECLCGFLAKTHQDYCPMCGEPDSYMALRSDFDVQLRAINKELRRRRAGRL